MTLNLIPVFIEKYLLISETFIYRQLINTEFGKIVVLTSSQTENLEMFPFPDIYSKSKNIIELFALKFYEKILRDRLFFNYYRVLSFSQKRYFENLLNDEKIKFIHAHFGTGALEIYKITEKLDKKLLVSFHGYDASNLLKLKSYRNNLRKFFNNIYIITPSVFMKKRLEKEIGVPKKSFIVHYGIPLDFYDFFDRESIEIKFSRKEKVTFLQVSNFNEKKGHIYTIKAFAKLLSEFNNVQLLFGGDGPLRVQMENVIKKLGIENHVSFIGRVNQEEVKELMSKADVFLHHSITADNGDQEGIPNVIMEAMATGLPVISTIHAGIPELITDGVNGYLVQEKDVDGYVEKMKYVLLNSQKSLIKNARRTIENDFNLETQLKKLNEIYEYLFKYEDEDFK